MVEVLPESIPVVVGQATLEPGTVLVLVAQVFRLRELVAAVVPQQSLQPALVVQLERRQRLEDFWLLVSSSFSQRVAYPYFQLVGVLRTGLLCLFCLVAWLLGCLADVRIYFRMRAGMTEESRAAVFANLSFAGWGIITLKH